jgi:methionyl-tRNA formyltransferase
MMKKKVIFMGSPSYAVPTLKALINSEYEILCVYTQSPKPAGRGQKIQKTPVHLIAEENNILVKTPLNFKDDKDVEFFADLNPDLAVVVAYGLIIPQKLLDIPKYGFMNLHPSALPKYRGAAPLQRTILAGEKTTDICVMKMDQGVDTGEVYVRKNITINPEDNFQILHDITSEEGAKMIIDTIDNIENISAIKQDSSGECYAHKIKKEEGEILFNIDNIDVINNKLRGLNPTPGVYFYINNKKIKIIEASISREEHDLVPGEMNLKQQLKIACIGGYIIPKTLQMEGKKAMSVTEFLNGCIRAIM